MGRKLLRDHRPPSIHNQGYSKGSDDEQAVLAGRGRPLSIVPSCRDGAADADAVRSGRHSERPHGRILHSARIEWRPDRSEATPVSIRGNGYAGAPGIYSDSQIAGWRRVTDAVHAKGGRIFQQLWHVGRQSHVDLQPNGEAPVAPSAIPAEGYAYTKRGEAPFSMPRALELHEIPGIIEEFRAGAERALRAGFDGVEIYGANGYLPDQFLQDGTNKRTDEYGGPIENRARFLLKVTQAAISVWGADRVGVRISPSGTYGSMSDSNPAATFGYVVTELDRLGIAYLHVVEPRIKGIEEISQGQAPIATQHLRQKFSAR